MFFSLEGEAQNAALELEVNAISSKDGVKIILTRLDKLYKKYDTLSKFKALDVFNISIIEYINEFEKHLYKKNYDVQMSDDVLAYIVGTPSLL